MVVKEAKRRRPRLSAYHITLHSMNGGPIPQSVIGRLEDFLQTEIENSDVRLLTHIVRSS